MQIRLPVFRLTPYIIKHTERGGLSGLKQFKYLRDCQHETWLSPADFTWHAHCVHRSLRRISSCRNSLRSCCQAAFQWACNGDRNNNPNFLYTDRHTTYVSRPSPQNLGHQGHVSIMGCDLKRERKHHVCIRTTCEATVHVWGFWKKEFRWLWMERTAQRSKRPIWRHKTEKGANGNGLTGFLLREATTEVKPKGLKETTTTALCSGTCLMMEMAETLTWKQQHPCMHIQSAAGLSCSSSSS